MAFARRIVRRQAAELIRRDEHRILVDLAGHTGGNRLLVFARKPAPIQVSYLGYLGTTGLAAMDYYLTDAHADPPGLADAHYQERLVRLPECGILLSCRSRARGQSEPPARQSGQVTFGCLNNPAKVTDEVLAPLVARCWRPYPALGSCSRTGARPPCGGADPRHPRRHGISPERLLLAGRTRPGSITCKLYHAVDIGLDPFPYNGVTTTCDALWMGVPVISLAGRMNVSRQGVRFLRSVGLDELLAETPEDYVRIATDLASDLPGWPPCVPVCGSE